MPLAEDMTDVCNQDYAIIHLTAEMAWGITINRHMQSVTDAYPASTCQPVYIRSDLYLPRRSEIPVTFQSCHP